MFGVTLPQKIGIANVIVVVVAVLSSLNNLTGSLHVVCEEFGMVSLPNPFIGFWRLPPIYQPFWTICIPFASP